MDIKQKVEAAIEHSKKRLSHEEQQRITERNERFDRMEKAGLVTQDKFGLSMDGTLRACSATRR